MIYPLLFPDTDECLQVDICDENAACQNTEGSFICSCRAGFFGNGAVCNGEDNCLEPTVHLKGY